MPFFSKVFKSKDSRKSADALMNGRAHAAKKQWSDAWLRTRVDADEVVELLRGCTRELKSRGKSPPTV